MEEYTLEALRGSIRKWENIAAGLAVDRGPYNCPLCVEFYDKDCTGCPVSQSTGDFGCGGTPYERWWNYTHSRAKAWYGLYGSRPLDPWQVGGDALALGLVLEEVDFLKGLLP